MSYVSFQSPGATLHLHPPGFSQGINRAGRALEEASQSGRINDPVSLSQRGREASEQNKSDEASDTQPPRNTTQPDQQEMDPQEQIQITQLKRRDAEVKAHEQAHLATAGQYAAGGASFTYQTGPDGRRYAVGGEVPISISKEKTPEETIRKMKTVARAALAPATPSSADRRIASRAAALEAQAMMELQEQRIEGGENESSPLTTPPSDSSSEGRNNTAQEPETSPDNQQESPSASPLLRHTAINAYRENAY